jgi:hypothetical protein
MMQMQPPALREGLNRLRIRWPLRNGDQRAKLIAAADTLVHQPVQPLYQVFGEVHSLTASPVKECLQTNCLTDS